MRANCCLRASIHASSHGPWPEVRSPMCTADAGGLGFHRVVHGAKTWILAVQLGRSAEGGKVSAKRRLETVGLAQQRERVRLLQRLLLFLPYSLADVPRRDRAIRADPVGLRLRHLAEDGPADLHRVLVVLLLHAPGAVVARAAFDRG